ncbi:N-acetylmuramoyl-L-alanine amidase [Streptomyces stelliscabiei]|uniref:N-acetylmuramoyl-L-alanine amidase n=1 Tax=Streptomyces stelliscabiei TaxID=146820 RepID=A0A8I0P1I1_9ACTN|nr:N-acetylmuramoyl-L-alanine amidase [Streptomyces stelliscabiei]KND46317.1 amidase [Streptomyces stelliscabiei]MBE1595262.1 N-acetyl-anhydromuramyl-L-alanine amidase AmpD [Streptomyces stelliscabiei]MDX2516218.1 N-acetylmuramoyl-L-alanine amidase [Streptomyces stelliscabiei]MDX2553189.1 N-acetylmuramoyl-L-alanine amidase [Streptomyces stelliscabiei]MDX2612177.1 N-acetylmuramoyl-L-alanine amidase [Streptomyces stelliscabiei]
MERARPTPSRRRLLRGTAFGAIPYVLLPSPRADTQPPPVDRAPALWEPASAANYTSADRPADRPIDLVIIHVTQTTYKNTMPVFWNPAKQVSAHYVLRSGDGRVTQCVRERDIAWHAGDWDYNARSIGIEHEGWVDRPEYFTAALYEQSAKLTSAICDTYGIPKDRAHIIGHHEVPGTDHTDPGPHWDWDRYIRLVTSA